MNPSLIPVLSRPFFGKIDLSLTSPLAMLRMVFNGYDKTGNKSDPTNCAFLEHYLRAPVPGIPAQSAILSCTKCSIDSDGREVEAGFRTGSEMDPDSGQDQTSLNFADGSELDSEGCPYWVLPGGNYGDITGLELGDVGVVIYRDRITAAILGDIGPGTGPGHNKPKMGEASIRVHNRLRPAAPDPCAKRDSAGRCVLIRNASIDGGVIFVGFPHSKIPDLLPETAQEQIEAKAFELWKSIGGLVIGG